jgi:hypothetical protein
MSELLESKFFTFLKVKTKTTVGVDPHYGFCIVVFKYHYMAFRYDFVFNGVYSSQKEAEKISAVSFGSLFPKKTLFEKNF